MSVADLGTAADPVSELYEVLKTSNLTEVSVEKFSATNTGRSAWGMLNVLDLRMLNSSSVVAAIANSESAMNAIICNTGMMTAFAWSETVMNAIVASDAAMTLICSCPHIAQIFVSGKTAMHAIANSESAMSVIVDHPEVLDMTVITAVAMDAIAGSETAINTFNAAAWQKTANSDVAMAAIAGNDAAMTLVADNETALTAMFNVSAARKIIWDAGKSVADILLLGSETAYTWLKTNVAITIQVSPGETLNTEKRGYALTVAGANDFDSEDYAYFGKFIGDYRTVSVLFKFKSASVNTLNERVNPVYLDNQADGSSGERATLVYIEME